MIRELKDTPNTLVGFVATNKVTKHDFDKIVLPAVNELVKRTDKLNYVLVVDTPSVTATMTTWMKDAMKNLNNLGKWHRVAIVSDFTGVKTLRAVFRDTVPGEYKGFEQRELDQAIVWAGEQPSVGKKKVFQEPDDHKE
jgi:hypothetical protein